MQIFLFLILLFLFAELITRYLYKYPVYGFEKRVRIRDWGWSNIYKPYSKYRHLKDRNQVFQRNNLGLPGIDVKISENSKYIFVLGSSSIEASHISPELMAVSVFQKQLREVNSDYQVVNLGYGGRDPFDLYRRAAYFEKMFNPSSIILIIVKLNEQWLDSHKYPLNFNLDSPFGMEDISFSTRIKMIFRKHSSLINLVYSEMRNIVFRIKKTCSQADYKNERFTERYLSILKKYKQKYGKNFMILSILKEMDLNKELEKFCADFDIPFYNSPKCADDNFLRDCSHLNEKGHELLGNFIARSFNEYIYERNRSKILRVKNV